MLDIMWCLKPITEAVQRLWRLTMRKLMGTRGEVAVVVLWEEETLPGYDESRFYPVVIGDIYEDRFEVLAKLGYGATSTIWLCRDRE